MNSGSPAAAGTVTAVRGSVVDVRFEGSAPPLHQMITAGDAQQVRLEVDEQRDEHTVRCLAFTSTSGLARGDQATASGSRSEEHTSELQSRGHLVCRHLLE